MRRKIQDYNSFRISPIENWRVTFLDIITLLMTFFILIVAMGTLDEKILNDNLEEFQPEQMLQDLTPETGMLSLTSAFKDRDNFILDMKQKFESIAPDDDDVFFISESDRGITLTIYSDNIFDTSPLRLKAGYSDYLSAVAAAIKNKSDFISIEGHAEQTPDRKLDERISLEMAAKVLDYFIYEADMSPSRFGVSGYGSARPQYEKQSHARVSDNDRIDIVILKSKPYPEALASVSG